MTTKLKEKIESLEKLQESIKEMNKTYLGDTVKLIFEEFPGVMEIKMINYTPGFNDGDPCENMHLVGYNDVGETYDMVNEESEEDEPRYQELQEQDDYLVFEAMQSCEDSMLQVHGTGNTITWARQTDGTVKMVLDYYDCGY